MSAFVVERAHIDHLVSAALYGPRGHHPTWLISWRDPATGRTVSVRDDPSAVGTMLWHANHASVSARYGDPLDVPFYTFDAPRRLDAPPAVVTLKAIDCYEYQSCEFDGWASSSARAFCDRLRRSLIATLPGYAAAPWSWTDEHVRA